MLRDERDLPDVAPLGVEAAQRALRGTAVVALVGPAHLAEAVAYRAAIELGVGVINLSLALGQVLQDISPRHRPVRLERALRALVPETAAVLIRPELLFEPTLATRPLGLFRKLQRSRPVVVYWPGEYVGGDLVYAPPGHPEHVREPADGIDVLRVGGVA